MFLYYKGTRKKGEDFMKKYLSLVMIVMCTGFACALSLKAAIGVGAWDAFAQALSSIINIKVGTMGMILNCSCVVGQLLILKKKFRPIQFLQVLVSIILGSVVNFMLYDILVFEINAYYIRLILILLAYVLCALFVGAIMVLDLVTFPLEGLCMALETILPFKFSQIRQAVDVICIVIGIVLSLLFNVPLAVREGTIIGMIIFAPLMGKFMEIEKPLFQKWGLIE